MPMATALLWRTQRSSRARVIVASTVALLLALSLLGPAAPVRADDTVPSKEDVEDAAREAASAAGSVEAAQRELAAAAARLQTLGSTLAAASERYNAAEFQLQQARNSSRAADAALADSERGLAEAERDLGAFASAAYRSGGDLARVSAMLDADGPQALFDQAGMMSVLGDRQSNVVNRIDVARAASVVLQQRAAAALAEQAEAAAEVRLARDAAEAAVEQQQAVSAALARKRDALVQRLSQLRGRSEALARERVAGLERAAVAAAAEQERYDEAALGIDGVPRGILLGMPAQVSAGVQRGSQEDAKKVIEYARAQIGKPYRWAATGPDEFDCSGLTMRAWERGGVPLAHWSVAQYAQGKKIPLSAIRPGDLVFFSTDLSEYRAIVHVGLYIGGGNMIEAPYTGANVKISPINRPSLFGAARP